MRKLKKKIVSPLKAFYNELADDSKTEFSVQVCQKCGLSWASFYRRLNDPSGFSELEKEAVSKIARKPVKTLFPDKKAKNKVC